VCGRVLRALSGVVTSCVNCLPPICVYACCCERPLRELFVRAFLYHVPCACLSSTLTKSFEHVHADCPCDFILSFLALCVHVCVCVCVWGLFACVCMCVCLLAVVVGHERARVWGGPSAEHSDGGAKAGAGRYGKL
jgi:hypothetical protein